jgi:hypothetical protein
VKLTYDANSKPEGGGIGGCGAPPSAINVAALLTQFERIANLPVCILSVPATVGKRATVANKTTMHTAIVLLIFDISASVLKGNYGAWIVTPRSPEPIPA